MRRLVISATEVLMTETCLLSHYYSKMLDNTDIEDNTNGQYTINIMPV